MQMLRPESVEEAVAALAEGAWRPLAGGTDVYPGIGNAPVPPLLDLSGIATMRGISVGADTIRLGALVTWSDVIAADLPPAFDALKLAARQVGGVQVQNAGTVAGNLCNASPAADGVPPLLALDASLEVAGPAGRRHLALSDFITGVRRTALAAGEIVTAVAVPVPDPSARSAFLKLGARTHLVISIAMAAAVIRVGSDGRIADAKLALGACSPVARRLPEAEAAVRGLRPGDAVDGALAAAPLSGIAPIDDVRATAEYRMEAARVLLARAIAAAVESRS